MLDDKIEKQQRLEDDRGALETANFVRKVFIRSLFKKVFDQIEENRRLAHQKRIYALRKEEQLIKEAKLRRYTNQARLTATGSIKARLDETFAKHATESEREQIATVDQAATRIEVPVHLAINQSIIAGVHAQSRLVNKCLLHLMYRKLSLVQHLAAVKAVFMSGNGDILEQFIGNLFAEDSQTHIAHVSNDIVNNALELSLRRSAAKSISLQKTSAQF